MIGITRAKNKGLWPSLTSFHLFPRLYWSACHCPGISTTRVEGWGNSHGQDISSLAAAFPLVDGGGKTVRNLRKPSQCHHYAHHPRSPTSSLHKFTFLITNLLLRNIIFPFLQQKELKLKEIKWLAQGGQLQAGEPPFNLLPSNTKAQETGGKITHLSFNWLPWWLTGKESACQCKRLGFHPWVRKIPWRRK